MRNVRKRGLSPIVLCTELYTYFLREYLGRNVTPGGIGRSPLNMTEGMSDAELQAAFAAYTDANHLDPITHEPRPEDFREALLAQERQYDLLPTKILQVNARSSTLDPSELLAGSGYHGRTEELWVEGQLGAARPSDQPYQTAQEIAEAIYFNAGKGDSGTRVLATAISRVQQQYGFYVPEAA